MKRGLYPAEDVSDRACRALVDAQMDKFHRADGLFRYLMAVESRESKQPGNL